MRRVGATQPISVSPVRQNRFDPIPLENYSLNHGASLKLTFYQADGGELNYSLVRNNDAFEVINLNYRNINLGAASEGKPFAFLDRGDNEPACTIVVNNNLVTIQNSSLHGMTWEEIAPAVQTIGLRPTVIDYKPLDIQSLAQHPTNPAKLVELQRSQQGNYAPGLNRPLDADNLPGGLVTCHLKPGQKAIVIGDLHDNLANLLAILNHYKDDLRSIVLVFASDFIHGEKLVIEVNNIKDLEKALAEAQKPGINITDAIGNLLLNPTVTSITVQGNHDQLYGNETSRLAKQIKLIHQKNEIPFPSKQAEEFRQALEGERGKDFAMNLNEFFFSLPVGIKIATDSRTIIVSHTPMIGRVAQATARQYLEARGIEPTIENMMIHARAMDKHLFGSGEDRGKSSRSVSASLQWSRLDSFTGSISTEELEETRAGFGQDALLVGGHTPNFHHQDANESAYLAAPGFVTLMSCYDNNLSVLEIDHTGQAIVVDLRGQSPLGGQSL
ncbi:MAG: metallophosphoesterase [Candidatus Margulisbacteria bacterium]|nr:metallophosphoesterase [Candidatus Margulisiibacteriota bacterium]